CRTLHEKQGSFVSAEGQSGRKTEGQLTQLSRFSFYNEYGRLGRADPAAAENGVGPRKLRAIVKDDGGIIYPGEDDDDGSGCAIQMGNIGMPQVDADDQFPQHK